jgi:O-antigen ligase
LIISAFLYANHYLPSLPALTLLAGAVIGQAIAAFVGFATFRPQPVILRRLILILVIFLALASVWSSDFGPSYTYWSYVRWTGPWDNPNLFGLLMGAGIVLADGMGLRGWKMEGGGLKTDDGGWQMADSRWKAKFGIIGLCLVVVILLGRGLFHSYSRGAWVGTSCGLGYLIWNYAHLTPALSPRQTGGEGGIISLLRKNWLPVTFVLFSVVLLSFWHFRQTDWHPARRALSSVNAVDFSWRNRVAAWEGDWQIIAEQPWFGTGWNQPEPLYERFYLPPKLTESMAIEMNDYLMLGATLGIPALFCFGMYLWLSLRGEKDRGSWLWALDAGRDNQRPETEILKIDWLQTTCRAGAIVLLVGFWFDGGLFKLATGSVFWILLELGSAQNHECTRINTND